MNKIETILILIILLLSYLALTENDQQETIEQPIIKNESYSIFIEKDVIIGNPNFETCEKYNLEICKKE